MATSPGAVCDGASRQMQGCARICRQTFSPYIEDLCWLRRWRCKGEKTRLVSWWLGWSGGLSQADLYVSFFICLCVYVFYFDGFFSYFPSPPFKFKNMSTIPCPLPVGGEWIRISFCFPSSSPIKSIVSKVTRHKTKPNKQSDKQTKNIFHLFSKDLVWL